MLSWKMIMHVLLKFLLLHCCFYLCQCSWWQPLPCSWMQMPCKMVGVWMWQPRCLLWENKSPRRTRSLMQANCSVWPNVFSTWSTDALGSWQPPTPLLSLSCFLLLRHLLIVHGGSLILYGWIVFCWKGEIALYWICVFWLSELAISVSFAC